MSTKRQSLQKPLTLVVAILYFSVFIFSTLAADTKANFLNIIKERFTKTPMVLTIGEQIMDFTNIAAPLLLALAFAALFFLHEKFPVLSSTVLLIAALVALSGITVFACLNTYNIIETFNARALAVKSGAEAETLNELTNVLATLISYQLLLIIYAGSIVSFSTNIKKQSTGGHTKSGGAVAFSIANALLAVYHLVTLITPPALTENYFDIHYTNRNLYTYSEISNLLCFATVAVLSFLFARSFKTKKSKTS